MQVGVLGPLRVDAGSSSIVPRAQQPRQVLAQLALAAGQIVQISELTYELWGGDPPLSSATTIQTYLGRLRRSLATNLGCNVSAISRDLLITHQDGYRLEIDADQVDAHSFDRMTKLGSRSLAAGRPDEASQYLSKALELWRGPVLVDVRTGPLLQREVTRLTLARLVAVEQRIGADLQLGRHYEVIAELADLTARHPLDEVLHQHYMLALYRTGRRNMALEVYHKLRTALCAELGLEPSRTIQRFHQEILCCDPALDLDEAARQN